MNKIIHVFKKINYNYLGLYKKGNINGGQYLINYMKTKIQFVAVSFFLGQTKY